MYKVVESTKFLKKKLKSCHSSSISYNKYLYYCILPTYLCFILRLPQLYHEFLQVEKCDRCALSDTGDISNIFFQLWRTIASQHLVFRRNEGQLHKNPFFLLPKSENKIEKLNSGM